MASWAGAVNKKVEKEGITHAEYILGDHQLDDETREKLQAEYKELFNKE